MTWLWTVFGFGIYFAGVAVGGWIGIRLDRSDKGESFFVFGVLWPLLLLCIAAAAPFYGCYRLATLPTPAERKRAHLKRMRAEIERLEDELGIDEVAS